MELNDAEYRRFKEMERDVPRLWTMFPKNARSSTFRGHIHSVSESSGDHTHARIIDADTDTYVWVEKTADEDIIHFVAAGQELMTIGHDGAVDISHTAAAPGEHALELIVDAAGKGNVHAQDIVLTTGAIGAGDDEEAILVNIDESAAGGGNVVALEVLATEGGADVHAVEAGVLIGPILQFSGTFMDMDVALVKAVDRLTEFITSDPGGGNNIVFFVANSDTITIGDAGQFFEIEFLLATVASKDVKPTFEYSKAGGLWEPFSPADGTNGMQNTGVIAWEADDVVSPAWAVHSGNYRIRITRTKGGSITSPIEDKVQIADVIVYEWAKDGTLNILKLGLGTAAPRKDLHIETTVPTIRLSASDAATDLEVATLIEFYRGNNVNRVGYLAMDSWANDILALATDYPDGELRLRTGSAVDRLTIDKDGNVGIGLVNPGSLLEIAGTLRVQGNATFDGTITTDSIWERTPTAGITLPHGALWLGVTDNMPGHLHLFGAGTGQSQGGTIFLYTSADHDAAIQSWRVDAWEDDLRFRAGTTEKARLTFEGLFLIDTVSELTPDAGVTIESVLIKDGAVDGIDISDHGSNADTHHAEKHSRDKHQLFGSWKALYTDAVGDEQVLALGAAGTVMRAAGTASPPTMEKLAHSDLSTAPADAHHAETHTHTPFLFTIPLGSAEDGSPVTP
ncbi:hypothetical protein LCGC14_0821540 [marine sediment metagenome]|uniref:Uncharacterized protein n=1 Tax=marine sediment metagenome TaxID=412755 RepID=A0A0F9PNC6_9ZZZZ